jgi:predicted dehydrogenase
MAKRKGVLVAPSCTMKFHPAIKDIKNIVESRKYGKVTNFSYHTGQYLPDWHPWEDIRKFYVSKKETGGCRELVPFELTWIVDVIGFPEKISGYYGKTMDLGVDIDDTYAVVMKFRDSYGIMMVDVVSRYATRSLILNMEYGQVVWRWDEPFVKLYDAIDSRWIYYGKKEHQTAENYNKNIPEDMYVEELKAFIDAVHGKAEFPNSLDEDIKVLKLLYELEGKL